MRLLGYIEGYMETVDQFTYNRVLGFIERIAGYDPLCCPDYQIYAEDIKEANELLEKIRR
jgi:hypothetical protein